MNSNKIFLFVLIILIIINIVLLFFFSKVHILSFVLTIILVILIIILLIYIIHHIVNYYKKIYHNEPLLIENVINARGGLSFPSEDIPKSNIGTEYTYSFWLYPSGWDYRYGKPKHVLTRGSDPRKVTEHMIFNPGIWFYPETSNLLIRFATYGNNDNFIEQKGSLLDNDLSSEEENSNHQNMSLNECKQLCKKHNFCKGFSYNNNTNKCLLKNSQLITGEESNIDSYIKSQSMNPYLLGNDYFSPSNDCDLIDLPIQRWSHVVVSLWNRTTDIYLNGKLVRSCILKNVPKIPHNEPLYVCQDGGFDGQFSQLRYFNRALNADQVYGLYQKGPIPWSFFGNNQQKCYDTTHNKRKGK